VVCDEELELPDHAKDGKIIEHCDTKQKLSYEWGSFAAKKV
jgi:hypothetical protein